MHRARRLRLLGLAGGGLALALCRAVPAAVPAVPVPAENPVTEPKRVLGKILFWDEQLSSDGSVACGTCHRPAAGGADPRSGLNPGSDKGTIDDVHGSLGIASLSADGKPRPNPVFGRGPQVTTRLAPSYFGGLWSDELFWDGRASSRFADPLTGRVAIARGGALENQALASLLNGTEMAKADRSWRDLVATVAAARPLALATDLPSDVAAAVARSPSYPALFAAAFGDRAITPVRIAFAIATYERTLVADRTPWDRYVAGDTDALTSDAVAGWRTFQDLHCIACHEPPLFTTNRFFQIGVRRAAYDLGRELVTRSPEDAGAMKVPSLRDAGLRPRYMHTGEFDSLAGAIAFYVQSPPLPERDTIPGFGAYAFNLTAAQVRNLATFIAQGLTDPRVQQERFPFDRPKLRSERRDPQR